MSHFFFPRNPLFWKLPFVCFPPRCGRARLRAVSPKPRSWSNASVMYWCRNPHPELGRFFFREWFGWLPLVWVKGVYILKLGTLAICWCFFAHILNKEDSLRGFGIAQRSEHVITVTYGEQLQNMFHPVKQAYYSYLSEVWLSLTDLNWGAVYVSLWWFSLTYCLH